MPDSGTVFRRRVRAEREQLKAPAATGLNTAKGESDMKRNTFLLILLLILCAALPCAGRTGALAEDGGPDYADAWVNHWEMENRPENTLDITRNGDGTLNMWFHFPDAEDLIFDFDPYDFESVAFGEPADFINGQLFIEADNGGRLEVQLFSGAMKKDHPLYGYTIHFDSSGMTGDTLYYLSDNPPDLAEMFGWTPDEGPGFEEDDLYVSEEECQDLFRMLSQYTMTASSGAGAWEGRLKIRPDGHFTGYYYDTDDDVTYEVSFSGDFLFMGTEKRGDTVYGLWAENLATENTPGTEAVSEYGGRIVYDEAPVRDREYLLLTLPGTPDDEIPGMVRAEIGGTWDEWEDYSRFITLTREDGWGFFADPGQTEVPELNPSATATPAPPVDGQVIVDDELWTLSVTGKEMVYGQPVYNLRIRNNSSRTLSLTISGLIRYYEIDTMDLRTQDLNWIGYGMNQVNMKLQAGSDLTYQMFLKSSGVELRTTDDLRMVDLRCRMTDADAGDGRTLREYPHLLLDWDDRVSLEDLLTPLSLITPQELSENLSVISIQALGTYRFCNGQEVILCQVANRSGSQLSTGASGIIKDHTTQFFFEPSVNGQPCAVDAAMRRNDGTLLYGNLLQPGETAPMLIAFRTDGKDVRNITDASFVLEVHTPTDKEALFRRVGRYVCSLHIDPAPAALSETPTPEPAPERDRLPDETPAPEPSETPATEPSETPAAEPSGTPAPADSAGGWTGYWMTRDDSMAEMIITENGDGTLAARAMFLPAGDCDAVLTPQPDGSMRFRSRYEHLIGDLVRQEDGSLRLTITGGSTMEDEEATEYQGYYARGFVYYPAVYDEMWYQTPEDAAATEEDWLGDWTAQSDKGRFTLSIRRENGALRVDISLGRYHFSGRGELASDTIMVPYDDDFSCELLLNRKLKRVAMMEVGSSIEEVYDLTGNPYYGVTIFRRADLSVTVPEELRKETDGIPPVHILSETAEPDPEPAEDSAGLLPIPGVSGCMQVQVSRVDATSYIKGKEDPSAYAPERMIDGDESTVFQFSTKTTKLGKEYLYFDFAAPAALDQLWIKNGYWKNVNGTDQYTRNCRVKKMTVSVRYAGSDSYKKIKSLTLKDDGWGYGWGMYTLSRQENVTGVRISIDAKYTGTKFKNDVCISEIMFVQTTGR